MRRPYKLRMVGGPYDGQQFDPPYDRDTPPETFNFPRPSVNSAVWALSESAAIPADMPVFAQYRFLAAVPDKFHAIVLALYAHVDPSYFGPPPDVIGTGLNEWQRKTLDVMAKRNGKIVVLMPKETRKAFAGPGGWRDMAADEITTYTGYVLGDGVESTKVFSNAHSLAGYLAPDERERYRRHLEEITPHRLAEAMLKEVLPL